MDDRLADLGFHFLSRLVAAGIGGFPVVPNFDGDGNQRVEILSVVRSTLRLLYRQAKRMQQVRHAPPLRRNALRQILGGPVQTDCPQAEQRPVQFQLGVVTDATYMLDLSTYFQALNRKKYENKFPRRGNRPLS